MAWHGVVWRGRDRASYDGRNDGHYRPSSQLEIDMRPLSTLSTATLRRKVHGLELRVRYHRNWNRVLGNDGFVVYDWRLNVPLTCPLDEDELRNYLIDALTE